MLDHTARRLSAGTSAPGQPSDAAGRRQNARRDRFPHVATKTRLAGSSERYSGTSVFQLTSRRSLSGSHRPQGKRSTVYRVNLLAQWVNLVREWVKSLAQSLADVLKKEMLGNARSYSPPLKRAQKRRRAAGKRPTQESHHASQETRPETTTSARAGMLSSSWKSA